MCPENDEPEADDHDETDDERRRQFGVVGGAARDCGRARRSGGLVEIGRRRPPERIGVRQIPLELAGARVAEVAGDGRLERPCRSRRERRAGCRLDHEPESSASSPAGRLPRTVTRRVRPRRRRGEPRGRQIGDGAGRKRDRTPNGERRPCVHGRRSAPAADANDPIRDRAIIGRRRAKIGERRDEVGPRHVGGESRRVRPRRVLERDRELEGARSNGDAGHADTDRQRGDAASGAELGHRDQHFAPRREALPDDLVRPKARARLTARACDHANGRCGHDEGVVAESPDEQALGDGDRARRPVGRHPDDHSLAGEDAAAQPGRLGDGRLRRRQRRDPWQGLDPGQLQKTELLRARGRRSERRDGDGEEHGSSGRHRVCSTFGSEADKRSSSTGANVMSRKRAK